MKKITNLLFLMPFFVMAQVNVDNQWKNSINPIFQNLDKTKIQSGMLLDYAMEFTDVTAYNGVLTDTTYIDINVLGDIYKTLFMAKVVADTVHTPFYDRYAYNWARERYKATKDSSSVYVLSGLLYEYQKFNENALVQNKITVSANKYYDKYTSGVWQNPYETRKTFALSMPIQQSRSKEVYFKLPSSLFLSNINNQIASIQIDADNGQGYKNFPFNMPLKLEFFENKIHNITYKITLTNNQVLYCRSKFKIDDPTLENLQQRGAITVSNERVYIHEDGNFFNAAWLTIRRIPGNVATNQITRPFIIAEGLDTGNFTAPEDFGGERTMQNFLNDVVQGGTALGTLVDDNNFNQQYDLIYIDWVRGMADMRDNSRVLEEVIKWVNDQKVIGASGVLEPNVLLGQSMGGVIGRYTLARMEQENKTHNVRLFITHDSPMQGANTPLAFSHFSNHMRQEYASTPLLWGAGEVLVPIGFGLAQLGSDLLNAFGANTSGIPAYVTPSQLLSIQDQAAARQLNYWSAIPGPNGTQVQTRSFNQSWQQSLTTMGWPTLSRNVAISNGNECSVNHGFAPGAPLLVIDSRSNPGFWLDALNVILAPLSGVATQDIGLAIVGALPGRSRWQTNFNFNTYGVQGSQNQIYYGRIRFEKKLLWIGPTIKYDITNKSFNAPEEALPFDTYSGGRFNFFKINAEGQEVFAIKIPVLSNLVNVVNKSYGFIPVVSSLDIKRNNGQVNSSDYLKNYAGSTTPEPALTSGFNNFIVDYNSGSPINNEHISFQVRNGNWLAEELQVNSSNPNYPNFNCLNFCSNAQISGSTFLCTTGIYSVTNEANPTLTNWSISAGSNLVSIVSNGNQVTINQKNINQSGTITLNATYENDKCGSASVTKTIWVGKPLVTNQTVSGGNDNAPINSSSSLNVAAAEGAQQYYWTLVEIGTNCGCTTNSDGLTICPSGIVKPKFTANNSTLSLTSTSRNASVNWGNCAGNYVVNCYAKNECGLTAIGFKSVRVYSSSGGGSNPCEGTLQVYPNPVNRTATNDDIVVNIVYPGDPCDSPNFNFRTSNENEIKIYDFYGTLVYTKKYKEEKIKLKGIDLKKGNYIINVLTAKGYSKKEVIFVE